MINYKFRNNHQIGFCGLGKQSQKLMIILKKRGMKVISAYNKNNLNNKTITKKIYPEINFFNSYKDLLNSGINIIFIATSHEDNYKFAIKAINKKINVFVEKPVFKNLKQINNLYNLVKKNNVFFQINYKFIFSPLFNFLTKLETINIQNIFFEWKKYGKFNNEILYELAIHDFAILFNVFINYKINKFKFISKIIEKDFIFFHFKIDEKNIVILIDRISDIYERKISFYLKKDLKYLMCFKNRNVIKYKSDKLININKFNDKFDENYYSIDYFLLRISKKIKINSMKKIDVEIINIMNKIKK